MHKICHAHTRMHTNYNCMYCSIKVFLHHYFAPCVFCPLILYGHFVKLCHTHHYVKHARICWIMKKMTVYYFNFVCSALATTFQYLYNNFWTGIYTFFVWLISCEINKAHIFTCKKPNGRILSFLFCKNISLIWKGYNYLQNISFFESARILPITYIKLMFHVLNLSTRHIDTFFQH